MITAFVKHRQKVISSFGIPELGRGKTLVWLKVNVPSEEEILEIEQEYEVDIRRREASVVDEANYIHIRTELITSDTAGNPHFRNVTFILGDRFIITVDHEADSSPLDVFLYRLNRKTSNTESPRATLRLLLQLCNDTADGMIDKIADELDSTAKEIAEIADGFSADGKELGVKDLIETMKGLNRREDIISHCVEAQLSLMRAVRYLNTEVHNINEPELQGLVDELIGDVAGVKEHAYFEYEKVRFLQNAVTNILNIKQNQIVKIFTIITAVFLPPTLVGTFYGMNFEVMPELAWKHGFIYSLVLTIVTAFLPLLYIKHKGWLR